MTTPKISPGAARLAREQERPRESAARTIIDAPVMQVPEVLLPGTKMPVHPVANLFPMMNDDELRDLAKDIRDNGLLVPIVIHDGVVVDGRNRWVACDLAGVPQRTVEYTGTGSLISWIAAMNLKRRHLTPGQKSALGAELEPFFIAEAKEHQRQSGIIRVAEAVRDELGRISSQKMANLPEAGSNRPVRPTPTLTRDLAAAALGVSGRSIQTAKAVMEAAPDLHAQVKQGSITLQSAAHQVRKEKREAARAALPPAPTIPERVEVGEASMLASLVDLDSVDLILTSPPYGLDKEYRGITDPSEKWEAFMADWLEQALRVAKPRGRLALNVPLDTSIPSPRPTYAQAVTAAISVGWSYQCTIVWDEGNTTKGNRSLGSEDSAARPYHVAPVEMIALFYKGEWGPSSQGSDDITSEEWQAWGRTVWKFPGESSGWEGHPAPFPEELPRRLMRYLSRVGDTVLDPFVGSGTTLVVARKLKRKGIGFDVVPEYVEDARRRLAEEPQ